MDRRRGELKKQSKVLLVELLSISFGVFLLNIKSNLIGILYSRHLSYNVLDRRIEK